MAKFTKKFILFVSMIYGCNSSAQLCGQYFTTPLYLDGVQDLLLKLEGANLQNILYFKNAQTQTTVLLYVENKSAQGREKVDPPADRSLEKAVHFKALIQLLQEKKYRVLGIVKESDGFHLFSELYKAGVVSLKIKEKALYDLDKKGIQLHSFSMKSHKLTAVKIVLYFIAAYAMYTYSRTLSSSGMSNLDDFGHAEVLPLVVGVALSAWGYFTLAGSLGSIHNIKTKQSTEQKNLNYYLLEQQWEDFQDALTLSDQKIFVLISEEFLEVFLNKINEINFEVVTSQSTLVQP